MHRSLDRVRIEGFLHPAELASIAEWCGIRGVRFEEWHQQPAARAWLDLAVARAVDAAITTGRARSRTAALAIVAGLFGLDGASVARVWRRRRHETEDKMSATSRGIPVGCDV